MMLGFLHLTVGSVLSQHYGIDEQRARETVSRALLKHLEGIAPPLY